MIGKWPNLRATFCGALLGAAAAGPGCWGSGVGAAVEAASGAGLAAGEACATGCAVALADAAETPSSTARIAIRANGKRVVRDALENRVTGLLSNENDASSLSETTEKTEKTSVGPKTKRRAFLGDGLFARSDPVVLQIKSNAKSR